ncbi:hypothetical protein FQA39_LY19055 [Lamprigera yunnana]|nr:hypothetical protein FQA39_LY19055 [Lamprigera yunnana]
MLHIFTYLDLKSLCRCAQVSKMWHLASSDPSLYRGISFKRYWHKVDNSVIEQYTTRCNNIKKLDLSWCSTENQIKEVVFVRFLKKSCRMVTHLSLDCCSFIHTLSLQQIGICKNLTDLRLRNCKSNYKDFGELAQLNKLIALDLYSSNIVDEELISILKSNRNLKYLIIDFCEYLESLDEVTLVASLYNSQLVTWSSWKTHSLTAEGVCHLANCTSLKELDLGWCLILNEPGNCLERISHGCKDLTRLIISGWRGITERHLLPIIQSCRHLSQLDLLGVKNVSRDICDRILKSLPKLKLLDISFCDLIRMEEVALWEEQYPYVVIQH